MKDLWNSEKMIFDLTVYRSSNCAYSDEQRKLFVEFLRLDQDNIDIDFDFDGIYNFVDTHEFANMFACMYKTQKNMGFFRRLFSTNPTLPDIEESGAFLKGHFETIIPKAIKAVSHKQTVFQETYDADSFEDYEMKDMVMGTLDTLFNRLLEMQSEIKDSSKFDTIQENITNAFQDM